MDWILVHDRVTPTLNFPLPIYTPGWRVPQPCFQGLLSLCPVERERRDPGQGWSRVSQNLGDDNYIITGRGSLEGIFVYTEPTLVQHVLSPK